MTDRAGVRSQGRFGSNRDTGSRLPMAFLAFGVPAIITVAFISIKLFQHYIFFNSFDASIYSNMAWNIAHGNGFWSDILQKNHLGEHFSPIMLLIAPLYRLWPSAYVLMVVQGLAVGAACWLLIPLSRVIMNDLPRNWQIFLTSVLFLMYLFYRPMLSALLCQFHPCTLGLPLLAGALLCLHFRKKALLALMVFFLLLTKEMAVLTVMGLGLYAWLVLKQKKTSMALGLTALLAAVVIFKVVMPSFQDEEWGHMIRLHPFYYIDLKFIYLARLVAPLALLPLVGWRALIPALPLISLNLVVDFKPQFTLIRHYDDQISVFLIAAAIHGARRVALWVQHWDFAAIRKRVFTIPGAVVICLLAGFVIWEAATYILRKSPAWSREEFQTIANSHRHLRKLQKLPPEVRLVSHSGLAPYLCHRPRFTLLKTYIEKNQVQSQDRIVFSHWRYPYDNVREVRQYLASHPQLVLRETLDSLQIYGVKQESPAKN